MRDPRNQLWDWRTYMYVYGNPVLLSDPLGEEVPSLDEIRSMSLDVLQLSSPWQKSDFEGVWN